MEKKTNNSPKISIITVVYNGEQYIERTIKSIIGQSYENIEFIIVDGNSTDRTKEIIAQYKSQVHQYISEKDKGIYDAMNKGLRLATGDYVWFINAGDEVFDSRTVEKTFEDYDYADVYYGDTQLTEEDGSLVSFSIVPEKLNYKSFKYQMAVSHQSIIIKREKIKEYNTAYTIVADRDWIISALKKSKKIKYTELNMSKYLVGGFSAQTFWTNWKEEATIAYKHFGIVTYGFYILIFFKAFARRVIEPYFSKKIIRNNLKKLRK